MSGSQKRGITSNSSDEDTAEQDEPPKKVKATRTKKASNSSRALLPISESETPSDKRRTTRQTKTSDDDKTSRPPPDLPSPVQIEESRMVALEKRIDALEEGQAKSLYMLKELSTIPKVLDKLSTLITPLQSQISSEMGEKFAAIRAEVGTISSALKESKRRSGQSVPDSLSLSNFTSELTEIRNSQTEMAKSIDILKTVGTINQSTIPKIGRQTVSEKPTEPEITPNQPGVSRSQPGGFDKRDHLQRSSEVTSQLKSLLVDPSDVAPERSESPDDTVSMVKKLMAMSRSAPTEVEIPPPKDPVIVPETLKVVPESNPTEKETDPAQVKTLREHFTEFIEKRGELTAIIGLESKSFGPFGRDSLMAEYVSKEAQQSGHYPLAVWVLCVRFTENGPYYVRFGKSEYVVYQKSFTTFKIWENPGFTSERLGTDRLIIVDWIREVETPPGIIICWREGGETFTNFVGQDALFNLRVDVDNLISSIFSFYPPFLPIVGRDDDFELTSDGQINADAIMPLNTWIVPPRPGRPTTDMETHFTMAEYQTKVKSGEYKMSPV